MSEIKKFVSPRGPFCLICKKPIEFYHYEGTAVGSDEEFEKELFSTPESIIPQFAFGGVTMFKDCGNYGSTILDCGDYWTLFFHDSCLMERKNSPGFVVVQDK